VIPAQAFTVHRILSPSDRTVVTACEQAGCLRWRHGWDSPVDESTPTGLAAAALIRSRRHGRSFRELPRAAGGTITVFRFEPYQRCFEEHRTRAELYLARSWTPVTNQPIDRTHTRPSDWTEHLHEVLDRRIASTRKG
jgi:hypothetical protein